MFKYRYTDLFNPLLKALHNLNGSGTLSEIEEEVARLMNLNDEELTDIHRGSRTKFSYRLAWARTYLKWYGLLENSSRGVWSLTSDGFKTDAVNKIEVSEKAKDLFIGRAKDIKAELGDEAIETEISKETNWQEELLDILQSIPPDRFERLCQRMLRELGFINVQVTGKSGDGGIDGKGVYLQI